MLPNTLRIALRTLAKRKTLSAVNIIGLALGSAVVLLIALFVHHERSYDAFHANADRIVQVIIEGKRGPGGISRIASVPAPLPDAVRDAGPQVEHVLPLKQRTAVVKRGPEAFESDVLYAGPAFFEMFSFPLVQGTARTALDRPDGVVLTTERAQQYFGRVDVVGETLRIRQGESFTTFTVTGVADPAPSTSSIPLGMVVPFQQLATFERVHRNPNWGTLSALLYVQLDRPGQTASLDATLQKIQEASVPEDHKHAFSLLPLPETHLTTGIYGQVQPTSDPLYSRILMGLAAFILALALINFTTLSLARSADRGREVGMRKALGARRRQVVMQLGGEALLTTGVSIVLGVGLALLAVPAFETLVDRSLDPGILTSAPGLAALFAGWLAVGLLASAYPVGVLSGFRPLAALREHASLKEQPQLVAALVVIQFVLAMVLVAGTFVMWDQFALLQEKNLGFSSERVVQIDGALLDGRTSDTIRQRFVDLAQSETAIQQATGAWQSFAVEGALPNRFEATSAGQTIRSHAYRVAPHFADTFDLTVVTGRFLSPDRPADQDGAVVVNQAFVDAMGWDEPLGKSVSVQFQVRDAEVVGVVQDFHFQSLRSAIGPLVMHMRPIAPTTTLFARIAPGQTTAALDALRAAWADVAPDVPFQFTFLDEAIQEQYRADQRWAQIVTIAAGFALFIAALGLLGLALLAAQRRLREISIRKVLGASEASVVVLVARRFAVLVAAAIVLALPAASIGAQQWLQGFAYRVALDWTLFAGAAVLVLALSLGTVSLQVWRATQRDPAQVLRTE